MCHHKEREREGDRKAEGIKCKKSRDKSTARQFIITPPYGWLLHLPAQTNRDLTVGWADPDPFPPTLDDKWRCIHTHPTMLYFSVESLLNFSNTVTVIIPVALFLLTLEQTTNTRSLLFTNAFFFFFKMKRDYL